jgi:hypothetical protein
MATQKPENQEITVDVNSSAEEIEVAIQDDTPEEDRGREPMPEDLVKELEEDELEDYSEKVKYRLKQMKKVWHDERRAKEAADRERAEAVAFAQRLMEENKALKTKTTQSEQALYESYKDSVQRELKEAQTAYKQAFESGDSDQLLEAQQALTIAQYKVAQTSGPQKTALQPEKNEVNIRNQQEERPVIPADPRVNAWLERNLWFGQNRVMTAMALGLHEEMVEKHGMAYATTDEYYNRIDKTMRAKFPEEFPEETQTGGGKPSRSANKPATVVAPASRSTAPKKVVLTETQVRLAKKFGITPEQYAREYMKLENQNG